MYIINQSCGYTYALEDLLAADILQAGVEVADALDDVLHLALVGALDLASLADGEVEAQLDAAVGAQDAQPVLAAAVAGGGEAEAVLAGVGGAEGEAAGGAAPLGDDAVIVVEELLFGGIRVTSQVSHALSTINHPQQGGERSYGNVGRTSTEM